MLQNVDTMLLIKYVCIVFIKDKDMERIGATVGSGVGWGLRRVPSWPCPAPEPSKENKYLKVR